MEKITYLVSPIVGKDLYDGEDFAKALEVFENAKGYGHLELKECSYNGSRWYLQSIKVKAC